jgi:hypothetical protein
MVYDLNLIILLAHADGGPLRATPQRECVSILDGLIAGEGNGPLQPLPVQAGVLLASRNPFLVDFAMAKLMGFDAQKIRLLAHYRRFPFAPLTEFHAATVPVTINGHHFTTGMDAISPVRRFLPAPGWRGHIELPC